MLSIVICAALAILIVFSDLSWSNVISSNRNALVFQNRNQEYGAFALRREHPRTMTLAILFVVGAASGLSAFGLINTPKGVLSAVKPPVECTTCDELWNITMVEKQKPEEEKMVEKEEASADEPEAKKPDQGLSTVEVTDKNPSKLGEIKSGGNPNEEGPTELSDPTKTVVSGGNGSGEGKNVVATTFVTFASIMPQFPGGEPGLYDFLGENIKFPDADKEIANSGTVYVSFIITKDGNVSNIKIERGFRGSSRFEKAIVEALMAMPEWTPGENGNQKVNVKLTLPVKFTSI